MRSSVRKSQLQAKPRTALTCALLAAAGLCAAPASAVNLSLNGTGQALIFPYYTVNARQQTLISVVNTTRVGKVVKVRFREAYNGRDVLNFNLYLSPADVWTGVVFALSDADVSGNGAAVFSSDNSCVVPAFSSGTLSNGENYQKFLNANFTVASADTGPTEDSRTREGHIEMILMSDVVPGSQLAIATQHHNSVPPGCAAVAGNHIQAADYGPPTLDPATGNPGTLADGGLFGSAAIVDVAAGEFYAYTADALDGFSYVSLYTPPGDPKPTLASVNDRDNPNAATAHLFASGETISATYPSATDGSRKIDAVSAVFAANDVQNEYVASSNGSVGTDWVLTLPTKYAYVDAQPNGAISGATAAYAPFDALFGATAATSGTACSVLQASQSIFDREENTYTATGSCGFVCPPPVDTSHKLCLETNVVALDFTGSSSVLATQLVPQEIIHPLGSSGWIKWDLSQAVHQLNPAVNGEVFHGLPITGFAAVKYVNGFLQAPGGGSALANYAATFHHHATTACSKDGGACQ